MKHFISLFSILFFICFSPSTNATTQKILKQVQDDVGSVQDDKKNKIKRHAEFISASHLTSTPSDSKEDNQVASPFAKASARQAAPRNDNTLDEKLYINSNTLEVDYENGIAEYQTNVFVQKKGNFDLYCNRAKIFSIAKESSKKNISTYTGNIKHIELYNDITIVKGTKIAKGDFGIIYPKKNLIILTGNVKLKEKTNTQESYLEGHEIKYYMDKEIFKISNNISQKNSKQGRVKIILNELKDKK